MGEKDYVFKFPGMEDYIRSGAVKQIVPDLEIIYIPEGSHFVHEQIPEKVNQLIIEFLDKQSVWSFRLKACFFNVDVISKLLNMTDNTSM